MCASIAYIHYRAQERERIVSSVTPRTFSRKQTPAPLALTATAFHPHTALREPYDAFDSAFGIAPIGIAAISEQRAILRWNSALSTTLGMDLLSGLVLPETDAEGDACLRRHDGSNVWVHLLVRILDHNLPGLPSNTHALAYVIDIHDRRAALEQYRHSSSHDSLTGLPNRVGFLAALVGSIAHSDRERACLFIDLDEFKPINDTLGHAAGDLMLVSTARKLQSLTSNRDVVARLHGDEYAVLLDGHDETQAVAFADAVQSLLQQPTDILGRPVAVSASIGVVRLTDEHTSAERVLRDADAAMYEAKKLGRRCVVPFDLSMRRSLDRRARLKTDLAAAIRDGDIRVAYQPVIDLVTRQVAGFEALARWCHPEEGDVPPAEFIPIVEKSDAIIDLGRLVMRSACSFLATLDRASANDLNIAVNVSVRQIQDGHLLTDIMALLEEFALGPERLTLELTEGAILENKPVVLNALRNLREFGVSLSLDDFGTGYSSLRYLHQFPIDVLKIDRAFVDGGNGKLASEPIVEMVTTLAKSLDLIVIAEGIEQAEQADVLAAHGCRFGQGYYFAKALERHDVYKWLTQYRADYELKHSSASGPR